MSLKTRYYDIYRAKKIAYMAWLEKVNLVDRIQEKLPGLNTLILYGSFAKGEDDKTSDIDLLAISQVKKEIKLSQYLGRETSPVIFCPSEWKEQAKKNKAFTIDVIIEGIVLLGTRPVVA